VFHIVLNFTLVSVAGTICRKPDILNSDRERRDAAKTMLAVAGEKSSDENEMSGSTKDKINISLPPSSLAITFHDQVSD
jgi:hypothetical protein